MLSMRVSVPVVACVVALVAGTARAEPFVGRVAEVGSLVHVVGSDGRPYAVQLSLTGVTPTAGATSYTLSLAVARCTPGGCKTGAAWVRQLTAGEVSVAVDESTAAVRTSFMGRPLIAMWTAQPSDSPARANAEVLLPVTSLRAGSGAQPAQLQVSLLGAKCRADGQIDARYVVASDGYVLPYGPPPPSRAPSYFAPSGKTRLTCNG